MRVLISVAVGVLVSSLYCSANSLENINTQKLYVMNLPPLTLVGYGADYGISPGLGVGHHGTGNACGNLTNDDALNWMIGALGELGNDGGLLRQTWPVVNERFHRCAIGKPFIQGVDTMLLSNDPYDPKNGSQTTLVANEQWRRISDREDICVVRNPYAGQDHCRCDHPEGGELISPCVEGW